MLVRVLVPCSNSDGHDSRTSSESKGVREALSFVFKVRLTNKFLY